MRASLPAAPIAVVALSIAFPSPGRSQTARITDAGLDSGFQDTWFGHLKRGRATVAADFDLDGRIDFYVGNPGDESFVIRNVTAPGGAIRFELVQTLLTGALAWGAAAADYDNDGDEDLYISCGGNEGIAFDFLFRNQWIENGDGTLSFVDVTGIAGISGPVPPGTSAPIPVASANGVWGDVDRDGFLDLFVNVNILNSVSLPPIKGRNVLWRNEGDGTFADVTDSTGLGISALRTRHSTFLDIDNDGDLDLYESNFKDPNVLWRNRLVETGSVAFENVTALFSPTGEDLSFPWQTFASASADFNQDGWEDIIAFMRHNLPEPPGPYPLGHAIFLNLAGTGFTNVAQTTGVNVQFPDSNGVMGCQVGDLDADGVPDLFFGNGGPTGGSANELFLSSSPAGQPPTYENWSDSIGYAAPEDSSLTYPPYPYRTHGTSFVDLNGDGALEIAVANGGPATSSNPAPDRLFTFGWTPAVSFLRVRPVGDGIAINRDGIGTRVTLTVRSGGGPSWDLHQTLFGGSAFSAQNGRWLHFGLADADTIESLQVLWPDGVTELITQGLAVNSSVVIFRGCGLPDCLCVPSEGPESSCSDGVDNDCDGFTDGADPDCSLPTAVSAPAVPSHRLISRNVPNPFRLSTTIRFALPESGPVDVGVYSAGGRLVRTLASGNLEAGDHELPWDATNDLGGKVASGVYFYRITSNGRHQLGKMLLAR